MPSDGRQLLIVVSAPSGTGKTTLCDRLLAEHGDIVYSVSCTTRPPRGREVDGVSYLFLDAGEFRRRLDAGEFLECARVHGRWYGTLRSTVRDSMAAGNSVLMDIDVQGADRIRRYVAALAPDDPLRAGFLDIFIEPPSIDALRARLTQRGEDAAEEIERRLREAAREMEARGRYRYRIVNDDIDRAYDALTGVIEEAGRGR